MRRQVLLYFLSAPGDKGCVGGGANRVKRLEKMLKEHAHY